MNDVLTILQVEHKEWQKRNFPKNNTTHSILGVQEEVGELSHAYLKHLQKIRTNENHLDNMQDAIGDIVIFLSGVCTSMGWNFSGIVSDTWNKVKQRDWNNNPVNGENNGVYRKD